MNEKSPFVNLQPIHHLHGICCDCCCCSCYPFRYFHSRKAPPKQPKLLPSSENVQAYFLFKKKKNDRRPHVKKTISIAYRIVFLTISDLAFDISALFNGVAIIQDGFLKRSHSISGNNSTIAGTEYSSRYLKRRTNLHLISHTKRIICSEKWRIFLAKKKRKKILGLDRRDFFKIFTLLFPPFFFLLLPSLTFPVRSFLPPTSAFLLRLTWFLFESRVFLIDLEYPQNQTEATF